MKNLEILNGALKELSNALNNKQNSSVFGLSFGEKALFLCNQKKQIMFVASNISNAMKLAEVMKCFSKNVKTILLSQTEFLSLSSKGFDDSKNQTIQALYSLSLNDVDCLIITPQVLMQKFVSKEMFKQKIFTIKNGQKMLMVDLINNLTNLGYKRVDIVEYRGEFSVKGDVVNLFDFVSEEPTKIDFFDDKIETIYHYNTETFKRTKQLKKIDIVATDFLSFDFCKNQKKIFDNITKDYQKTLNTLDVNNQYKLKTLFEEFKLNFENSNYYQVKNWLIPYLEYVSIEDYLKEDAIIVFEDAKYIYDAIKNEYDQFENMFSSLKDSGEILLSQKDCLIKKENVFNFSKTMLSFQQITTQNRIFSPTFVQNYKSSLSTNYHGKFDLLFEEVKYYLEFENKIFIFAGTKDFSNYLSKFLRLKGIFVVQVDDINNVQNFDCKSVYIARQNLSYGGIFVEDKIVIIGTNELRKNVPKKGIVESVKKDEFTLPKQGDYVVHESFGIALCEGVKKLKFSDYEKDYIILKYEGGDKLYLPTEQIGLISAYISNGEPPKLNKLGTKDFENIKTKVKAKLKELAFDLVSLYREREDAKGFKFEVDNKLFKEFENSFPYEETSDQTSAIKDILDDMKSGKVMDRIVCGDVGYGKTEVALRSAFVSALNSKQVCFLCPTTILSAQHFNTAKSRLERFGIRVEVLNRFKTKAEQKQILQDLKNGDIDVICGTHRLLSKDVVFKDLGLLILDEEQRFGVEDKEKIKRLKTNIEVLTLSATPIPRTLHMGLVGIRDISVISTPPKDRLPVMTKVAEYSDSLILSAIKKELARDGQVLIIYNRVETIYEFLHKIRSLVGEDISIGVAHGQMEAKELEEQIMKLYNGDTKILISTTLIENGVDLPSANTLIIIDADKLGLSQLYQLKGRVGRSKNLGYAYFTFKRDVVLSQDAYKRLNAIMEFTELGSGFKIAMKDLEIRGCGNILGAEQSGHMAKVGYDMYCKILSQAVSEIKGQKQKEYKDIKLDVAIDCFIPENYIEVSENRFRVYNNLKQIDSREKREKTLVEIESLFGKIPEEVFNLSLVAELRNLAREFDVKRISIDRSRAQAEFYEKTKMLDKNIAFALKNDGVKVYYSDVGIVMNFMLSEYSVKKKLEIICKIFEEANIQIQNLNIKNKK